jgi:hypothetical protein
LFLKFFIKQIQDAHALVDIRPALVVLVREDEERAALVRHVQRVDAREIARRNIAEVGVWIRAGCRRQSAA